MSHNPELLCLLSPGLDGKDRSGGIFVSCMPGSSRFDAEDEVFTHYEALHHTSKPLFVAWMTPHDEAARMRARQQDGDKLDLAPLEELYNKLGADVHQIIIDGFPDEARERVYRHANEAATAVREGRNVVSHCHSGLGRGAVFAVFTLALLRGATSTTEELEKTLKIAREATTPQLLAKENPLKFFLSLTTSNN